MAEPGGVAKSRMRLIDFIFTFHFHALVKEMATHTSVLAWRIPGTGEPGGLPSMGSHRVRHDWSDLAAAAWLLDLSQFHSSLLEKFKQFCHIHQKHNCHWTCWLCLKYILQPKMLTSSAKCGVANCHSQTQCIWNMPKNSPWVCYWAATLSSLN